jgi:hypothetical protein
MMQVKMQGKTYIFEVVKGGCSVLRPRWHATEAGSASPEARSLSKVVMQWHRDDVQIPQSHVSAGSRYLTQRRLRIEHVNNSVKRCRIVKDRIRLWKQGVRDLVMEFCCALHNFRVRLTPWQPTV